MFRCQQLGRLGSRAATGQPECLSPASGGLQKLHMSIFYQQAFIVISQKGEQDESLCAVYVFLSAVVSVCFDLHVHRGAHICACPGYMCVWVPVRKLVMKAQRCSIFPLSSCQVRQLLKVSSEKGHVLSRICKNS